MIKGRLRLKIKHVFKSQHILTGTICNVIVIYRPLEVKGHSDGCAAWDGGVIGPDNVGVSGAKGAGWLRWDNVLRVLEANSKEYVTVSVSPADALRRVKWMDFQLKHAGRENLKHETKTCFQTRGAQSRFQMMVIAKTKSNLPHELRPKSGSTLGAGVPFLPSFCFFTALK